MAWLSGRVILCGAAMLATGGAAPANKLQRIFQFETFNARIPYLESIIGPAMYVFPTNSGVEQRDYKVDGCRVGVGAKDGNVRYLRLEIGPRCNVSLAPFLGDRAPSTSGLTVSRFASAIFDSNSIKAQSACIYLCGNAADPTVDFTWNGPHAFNFITATAEVVLAYNGTLEAEGAWESAMTRARGHKYVEDTRFNCDRSWDAEALKDFGRTSVHAITVGFDTPADA